MNDEKLIELIKNNPDKGIHEAMQIYGKAVNTICRSILRNHDEGLIDEAVSDMSIENEVQKKELKQMLHEVIEKLGEPDNQVFLMKYFLFMRNKDIAAKLQISEKKVDNILFRGKGKLKEMLIRRGITCYEE